MKFKFKKMKIRFFIKVAFVFLLSGSINPGFAQKNIVLSGEQPGNQGEWKQLFNGKDHTGWKHVGDESMSVENGLVRGHGGMDGHYWQWIDACLAGYGNAGG